MTTLDFYDLIITILKSILDYTHPTNKETKVQRTALCARLHLANAKYVQLKVQMHVQNTIIDNIKATRTSIILLGKWLNFIQRPQATQMCVKVLRSHCFS